MIRLAARQTQTMDRSIEIWYFSIVKKSASPSAMRPARVGFARQKYGRELLVDAAFVKQMPTFITDRSPHSLAFFDILLVTRGRGEILLDAERYTVEPGVVVLCMPGQVREWRLRGKLDGACVFFTDTFITETFADPRFLEQFLFFRESRPSGALRNHLKNRNENQPRFSTSILVPSRKFSGPCSIITTQQKVAIANKASQSTQIK